MTFESRVGIGVDGKCIPEDLKKMDIWVVWDGNEKLARAPWQDGHMYPAEWSENSGKDPRDEFGKANMVAEMDPGTVHQNWSHPEPGDIETIEPTPLLPHKKDTADPPVMFVDYDEVVEDGSVTEEVWGIVDRLGGPTFLSSSGTGLHQWVRAELPEGLERFIANLDSGGHIEMYDHGRMTGSTWKHISETPEDVLPEAQESVSSLVEEYATEEHEDRVRAGVEQSVSSGAESLPICNTSGKSAYYDLDTQRVADQGSFARYRKNGGDPWQGPHPGHGGTSSSDSDSINFNVDGQKWHCFAHGDGGGALELIAVVEGVVSCGNSQEIHNTPEKLLETCLYARDKYSTSLEDEKPPYDALTAVADITGIGFENKEERILGENNHKVALRVYDDLSASDL